MRTEHRFVIGAASDPEVINIFFMLNLAEHEICHAYKSQITNNC